MPYSAGDLSMLILLPDRGTRLEALESSLSSKGLADAVSSLQSEKLDVSIPKFRLTSQHRLDDALGALGMKAAFDVSRADFKGIAEAEQLFVDAVLHKAFVDVNEEGTEAAAAPTVKGAPGKAPKKPPAFKANRPFLFLIRDRTTGAILFLGRVVDPR
jgi:serpin B